MTNSPRFRVAVVSLVVGVAALSGTSARASSTWTDLGAGFSSTAPAASRSVENSGQNIFVTVYATLVGTNEVVWTEFQNNVQITGWNGLNGWTFLPPTAIAWAGHREVFVAGTDHQLYHASSGSTGGFGGWQGLGGPQICTIPSAVSWGTGRIDVFSRGCSNSHLIQFFTLDGTHWSSSDRGVLFSGAPSACSNTPGTLDVWLRASGGTLYDYHYDGSNWSLNNTGGPTAFLACGKTNPFNTRITSFAFGSSNVESILGFLNGGGTPPDFEVLGSTLPLVGWPGVASCDMGDYFYGRLATVGMQRNGVGFIPNTVGQNLSVSIVSNPSDGFASDPAAVCPNPRVNATKVFAVRTDGHMLMLDDTGL